MWAHLIDKKKKKKKRGGPNDDISPSCFRGTPGRWLKKSKRQRTNNKHKGKKREERGQKKDKTNRARRRVKAKRSDVDLEFLTREFHPRIVPVEEERVQSDIKKG